MKRTVNTLLLILLFWSLGMPNAAADNHAQSRPMSIADCMSFAVENAVQVKTMRLETDNARWQRREAILAMFTPQVQAGSSLSSNFGRSLDPETNTYVSTSSLSNAYSVSGGMILFDGFSAVNNMRVSNVALQMGIDREQLAQDEICLATMEAFCNVLYFNSLKSVVREQVNTAKSVLMQTEKQAALGQKSYADVVEMQAELADYEYRLIDVQNRYDDAMLTLKDLMFWPVDEALVIDTLFAFSSSESSLQPALEYATQHLPSVRLAKASVENARYQLNTAKWRFAPSLSLNMGWSTRYYTYPDVADYEPDPFRSQFKNNGGEYLQLSLSLPVFNRLSNVLNVKKRSNAYAQASLEYEQTLRQVEAEVRRAAQDKQAALAAYRQAEKRAALQEEAYRLNKKKFQQGLVSPLDFRKASEQCLNAKSACLQNELQYRIKDSVLAYFSGIPYIEQF